MMLKKLPGIGLITRADDAGLNRATNRAIRTAVQEGIARNISLMSVGPEIEHAAAEFHGLDVCFGFHVCLTAEWDHPRWGSVMAADKVPSLLQADGTFPRTLDFHRNNEIVPQEFEEELSAQLKRLRMLGFQISYLDEHMGISSRLPFLRSLLVEFARREGLVYQPDLPGLPKVDRGIQLQRQDYAGNLLARLRQAAPGVYLVVAHPASSDGDMLDVTQAGKAAGEVADDREREGRMFLSEEVLSYCATSNIAFVRYDELVPS